MDEMIGEVQTYVTRSDISLEDIVFPLKIKKDYNILNFFLQIVHNGWIVHDKNLNSFWILLWTESNDSLKISDSND